MPITHGNSISGGNVGGTVLTIVGLVANGDYLYASCNISFGSSSQTVNAVTYNGVALTQLSEDTVATNEVLWTGELINPTNDASAHDLVFNVSASSRQAGGAHVMDGVDQTTPSENPNRETATSTTLNVTITSETDDVAISGGGWEDGGIEQTANSHTLAYTVEAGTSASDQNSVMQYGAGAATVEMEWTIDTSDLHQSAGSTINPAAAAADPLPRYRRIVHRTRSPVRASYV